MRYAPPPRVLIAGCGYLGSQLGTRLAATGSPVWGLRRNPSRLPTSVQRLEADLTVPNTMRHLPDVDFVFYMAHPSEATDRGFRSTHVDGLRYFLDMLSHARGRPKRLFLLSTVAVYGARLHDCVDESSPADPDTPFGEQALAAERLVAAAALPTTVLRLGDLYGPNRLGLMQDVVRGETVACDPEARINPIHRDDAIAAMLHLMNVGRPDDCYLVVDHEPTERLRVLAHLADQVRRPMPVSTPGDRPLGTTYAHCLVDRLVDAGVQHTYPSFRHGYRAIASRISP